MCPFSDGSLSPTQSAERNPILPPQHQPSGEAGGYRQPCQRRADEQRDTDECQELTERCGGYQTFHTTNMRQPA